VNPTEVVLAWATTAELDLRAPGGRYSRRVMFRHPSPTECRSMTPDSYVIRVRGRIGHNDLSHFEGFAAEPEPATTVLRGTIDDQSALHGMLVRIQALGLELVDVRHVGRPWA